MVGGFDWMLLACEERLGCIAYGADCFEKPGDHFLP